MKSELLLPSIVLCLELSKNFLVTSLIQSLLIVSKLSLNLIYRERTILKLEAILLECVLASGVLSFNLGLVETETSCAGSGSAAVECLVQLCEVLRRTGLGSGLHSSLLYRNCCYILLPL